MLFSVCGIFKSPVPRVDSRSVAVVCFLILANAWLLKIDAFDIAVSCANRSAGDCWFLHFFCSLSSVILPEWILFHSSVYVFDTLLVEANGIGFILLSICVATGLPLCLPLSLQYGISRSACATSIWRQGTKTDEPPRPTSVRNCQTSFQAGCVIILMIIILACAALQPFCSCYEPRSK